jgi:hypothetical protein
MNPAVNAERMPLEALSYLILVAIHGSRVALP